MNHHELRTLIGPHVLGALDDEDERDVTAHLAECDACRAVERRLAELPALLDLAHTPRTAPGPEQLPAGLEAAMLDRLGPRAGRRRDRVDRGGRLGVAAVGGLAGAAVMAALLAATVGLGGPGGRAGDLVALTPSSAADAASRATADLRPDAGGVTVELVADGLRPTSGTEVYEVWFVNDQGRVSAGTFTVGPDRRVRARLTSAARPGAYARVGITLEPDGLDPSRNGPNVLTGQL